MKETIVILKNSSSISQQASHYFSLISAHYLKNQAPLMNRRNDSEKCRSSVNDPRRVFRRKSSSFFSTKNKAAKCFSRPLFSSQLHFRCFLDFRLCNNTFGQNLWFQASSFSSLRVIGSMSQFSHQIKASTPFSTCSARSGCWLLFIATASTATRPLASGPWP